MNTPPNHRFIFTGGPGSGKTTLLSELENRGYRCVPETARIIIKTRLEAGLSPRPKPEEFAKNILDADIANYANVSSNHEVVFFDRSIVDALGMLSMERAISDAALNNYLRDYPYHPTVFIFPPWQEIYQTDDERDQTFSEAIRVFEIIRSWYQKCGYSLLEMPLSSVANRIEFVEQYIAEARAEM